MVEFWRSLMRERLGTVSMRTDLTVAKSNGLQRSRFTELLGTVARFSARSRSPFPKKGTGRKRGGFEDLPVALDIAGVVIIKVKINHCGILAKWTAPWTAPVCPEVPR